MPINKPVYLGLLILEISKVVVFELWYDNVKPKYGEKAKKTLAQTVQKILKQDYKLKRPLPEGKKVIGFLKSF